MIEAIEHDERLTRSVHFWRDFARHRSVLGVHEAAYAALATRGHPPQFSQDYVPRMMASRLTGALRAWEPRSALASRRASDARIIRATNGVLTERG